jgi:hypothetical protein
VTHPEGSLRFANFAGFLEKTEELRSMSRVHPIPETIPTNIVSIIYVILQTFHLENEI